ncbi:MAG: putative bifunctional diguanylate cyclase/phosphodiesterase, partial [Selenomonadaceae bacterium]
AAEVFRISGDEFIVLAPGRKTKEQAAALAEVACNALSREYNVAGETIHLSASIGVVCYPQQADWPEELLKMADAAMYAAKAAGRNCWRFFEPRLLQKTADDMMMLNALRRALVKNEFFLVYQPQFTTDGRRIVGFEALLRWNSEEYGLVPPSSFIPLAERSSLILEIGQWVLQESCRFAAQLAENAWGDVHIAANISTRQMRSEEFVSLVKENVEKFSLRPAQLELEITESILMENMTEGIATLKELHAYGCRLALDDFGTGFSSLTYLRNLPVDCLKIDKSFIDTIALDMLQKKMVCSIIGLGHTLGM